MPLKKSNATKSNLEIIEDIDANPLRSCSNIIYNKVLIHLEKIGLKNNKCKKYTLTK